VALAEPASGDEHLVAGRERRVVAGSDGPGEIDAGHVRMIAYESGPSRQHERILVVD
jgi:hypothetical protein